MALYYITDRSQFPGNEAARRERLLAAIVEAARCGVDYIQLREKDLSASDLQTLATQALAGIAAIQKDEDSAAAYPRTRLLINSCVDVAIAAGAHGVHLRASDITASQARILFHNTGVFAPVIAASCHSLAEVEQAEAHGANFAVFGPVFGKQVSEMQLQSGAGIEALDLVCRRAASASSRMPVLALGGITLENAQSCLDAGAAGVAGIRLFQSHPGEMKKTVAALRQLRSESPISPMQRRHPYQTG